MPAADLPIVARALSHQGRTAVVAAEGTFTYRDLIEASERVAACLLNGRADLVEARVAFLVPAGWHYVATQWGIWRAGGVAVPLATSHPPAELEHVIQDAEPEIVVAGMLPDEAAAAVPEITTASFPFAASGRALTLEAGASGGFVRIVADRRDGRVLGIQAVGRHVAELAGEFAHALAMGAVLDDLAHTIHVHPTLGEAVGEAALIGLGQPLHL